MGLRINKLLNLNLSSKDSPNSRQKRLVGMQTLSVGLSLCAIVLYICGPIIRDRTLAAVLSIDVKAAFERQSRAGLYLSASVDFQRHAEPCTDYTKLELGGFENGSFS